MQTVAQLIFKTSHGGSRTVTIPNPHAVVSQTVLDDAVTAIKAANPFDETIGTLDELINANRVTVNRIWLIESAAA